jgi:hypothetical protein
LFPRIGNFSVPVFPVLEAATREKKVKWYGGLSVQDEGSGGFFPSDIVAMDDSTSKRVFDCIVFPDH